jgi:hypothetical protein
VVVTGFPKPVRELHPRYFELLETQIEINNKAVILSAYGTRRTVNTAHSKRVATVETKGYRRRDAADRCYDDAERLGADKVTRSG